MLTRQATDARLDLGRGGSFAYWFNLGLLSLLGRHRNITLIPPIHLGYIFDARAVEPGLVA